MERRRNKNATEEIRLLAGGEKRRIAPVWAQRIEREMIMAKKPTTPTTSEPSSVTAAPKKAAKAKAPPKAKETAKPKAAKTPATRTRVKATAVTKPAASITPADIALRAYFIAEKRQKLGLPGDSTHDWVEAERQLHAEAAASKAKK